LHLAASLATMPEPGEAIQTTTQFVLRSDFPNIFITNEDGRDRYWVRSGVAQRLGLWSLRDLTGRELVSVQQQTSWPLPTYGVYQAGEQVATVSEAPGPRAARWRAAIRMRLLGTPAGLHYTVHLPDAQDLEVESDPEAVEYHFSRAGRQVATVGLQWLAWAPTFGLSVRIAHGEDATLILALTAMIESAWRRL
jgi:uncharacterized protein YxjI